MALRTKESRKGLVGNGVYMQTFFYPSCPLPNLFGLAKDERDREREMNSTEETGLNIWVLDFDSFSK